MASRQHYPRPQRRSWVGRLVRGDDARAGSVNRETHRDPSIQRVAGVRKLPRRARRVGVVAVALAIAGGLGIVGLWGGPAAAPGFSGRHGTTAERLGFWIAVTSNESLNQAVINAVHTKALSAARVEAVLKQPVPSDAATPVTTELAFRSTAADRGQLLTATELEKRTPGAGVAYLANADRSSNAKARGSHLVADIQPLDNPGFDAVRGQAVADRRAWQIQLEVEGCWYDADGCVEVTDDFKLDTITNPGAETSRIDWSWAGGSFDGGDFWGLSLSAVPDCGGGADCGYDQVDLPTTGTGQPTSSGQLFSTSIHARNGATVGHSLTLDGWYSPPDGSASQEIWDTAETGTASCNTSDNVCTY